LKEKLRRTAKRLSLFVAILVILSPAESRSSGFELRLGTGLSLHLGDPEELDEDVWGPWIPVVLDIGYKVNDEITVFLEGQLWWTFREDFSHPGVFLFSLLGKYRFNPSSRTVRPFALLGLGYGWVLFFNEITQENDASGMVQLQVGGGFMFPIESWLGIGVEARIRVGVPHNPEMVSPSLLCVLEIG
jgi:hypothetical protein